MSTRRVLHRRGPVEVGAVYGDEAERCTGDPRRHRTVVAVDDPHAGKFAGRRLDWDVAIVAVDSAHPVVDMGERHDVHFGGWLGRCYHEGAEQAAAYLFVRDLVRVVPERADLVGDEPVDELRPDPDRVLGDSGNAVHGVGHIQAMPVQRDAVRHRLVDQPHLDQLSGRRADGRAGRLTVERVPVDVETAAEPETFLAGGQRHRHVGRSARVGGE